MFIMTEITIVLRSAAGSCYLVWYYRSTYILLYHKFSFKKYFDNDILISFIFFVIPCMIFYTLKYDFTKKARRERAFPSDEQA